MTFGHLCINAQVYFPVLLENLHGMSCSGACWILSGAWCQCRYGNFWMSSYKLMFPGVRSSLAFSGFGLKPPASGFQSYSYSSLKTSPSIQVNGEKILHYEGHPERFTVLHGEEKREEGVRGDPNEMRWNQ